MQETGPALETTASPTPTWRLLGHADFGPYFAGNLLSNCGTWFQNIAQAILVFRLTHSTFLVGVVNFAQFAGVFLLASWAGRAADRFDRRRLLVVTQLCALAVALTMAALVRAGLATAPVVIVLAFALGLTIAFAIPALQALVPLLVEPHDLPGAIALNSITFNLARAVGPVLAAVVIRTLGLTWAFALNGASFLALIAALGFVHPRPQHRAASEHLRLRDSIAIVRADARLFALFMAIAAVSLTVDPVTTLTPAFSTEVFHRADTLTGFLVGAFGVGAVAAVSLVRRIGARETTMALTLLLLAAGMAAFGLAPTVAFALVALALAGVGYLLTVIGATTAIQLGVDDRHRGRVMALWSIAFLGLRPFGSLVAGAVGHAAGVRAGALLMAVPAAGVAVAFAVRRRG